MLLTNLGNEGSKAPWVHVEQDASDVAGNFMCATQYQAPHEPPGLPFDPKVYMQSSGQGKDGGESDVGSERWPIPIDTLLDRAELMNRIH